MSTVNFNDTTPTAPIGFTNGKWQSDSSGNISLNYPVVPNSRIVGGTANDNVTTSDQYLCYVPTAAITVNLPVSPLPNQALIIRNAQGTYNITLNGNGNNVSGFATYVLYAGAGITLLYDQSVTNWRAMAYVSSAWMTWTPTVVGNPGTMTVSALSFTDSQWIWESSTKASFKLNFGATLGGTAASSILISLPLPLTGGVNICSGWGQLSGQGAQLANLYIRTDVTNNIFVRTADATAYPLGATTWTIAGFWRIT